MDQQLLPLVDVIGALRAELATAMEAAQDEVIRFELGPIECEFETVVTRELAAKAGFSFKVLSWGADAGANGKLASERTQKVKIVLTPVSTDGKVLVTSMKK